MSASHPAFSPWLTPTSNSSAQPSKGDIITPSDEGYEQAIDRWAKNAIRRARIVAYVKDAEDVGTAIEYAKASGLPLTVRGGGHSPNGASSTLLGIAIV